MKKLQVQQPKANRYLYLMMMVIFLPQGFINVASKEGTISLILGVLQIILSLIYIPLIFGKSLRWTDPALSPILLLGPKTIGIKSWWSRNASLAISDIEKVQFKPEEIAFIPTNEQEIIYFSHFGPNSTEIIHDLRKFCEYHQLETEEIGYR